MIFKAYKYRIYPNKKQINLLSKHFGSVRWVYNYALEKKTKAYQLNKQSLSRFQLCKDLTALKKQEETKWLKDVYSQSLQSSLEHLDKAFTKFFKDKKGYPKFKSKHDNRQSFTIHQNAKIDFVNKTISLPKFKEPIKCKISREFTGTQKTVTVSVTPTGKYYVSVLVAVNEDYLELKPIDENKAIGIDLGIRTFATLSNGDQIPNPRYLRKELKKLKRQCRRVSKKVKGSSNRKKAVKKLAIIHERVTNKRNDFLHKVTTKLVSEYDTICLETLRPSNMMKNHKLAQALSDISIGKFNELIDYKAKLKGVNILRIGQFEPSSKMCTCGVINSQLKLSDREWVCESCGEVHDRDLLAANNIKRFAFSKNSTVGTTGFQACGDVTLVMSEKQEGRLFNDQYTTTGLPFLL